MMASGSLSKRMGERGGCAAQKGRLLCGRNARSAFLPHNNLPQASAAGASKQ